MILPLRHVSSSRAPSRESRRVFRQAIALLATIVFALLPVKLKVQAPPRPFSMPALSPEFWALFDRGSELETVAQGFGLTEGPMCDPAGFLYVSDETINKTFRVFLDGRKEKKR